MAEVVTFDELSQEGKAKAIADFINFYIPRLRKNNLEILSMFKVDYALSDISHFIFENRSFTPEELKQELAKECNDELSDVISTVNLEYYDNGDLVTGSWDSWYDDKFKKVSSRD